MLPVLRLPVTPPIIRRNSPLARVMTVAPGTTLHELRCEKGSKPGTTLHEVMLWQTNRRNYPATEYTNAGAPGAMASTQVFMLWRPELPSTKCRCIGGAGSLDPRAIVWVYRRRLGTTRGEGRCCGARMYERHTIRNVIPKGQLKGATLPQSNALLSVWQRN